MNKLKLHVGIQILGKKIETYKSIRIDLYHDREGLKILVCRWIDDLYEELEDEYESEEE